MLFSLLSLASGGCGVIVCLSRRCCGQRWRGRSLLIRLPSFPPLLPQGARAGVLACAQGWEEVQPKDAKCG
ncbi:unnamed protein product, partial [Ectocarpus sp. 13 AM-2016]